MSAAFAVAREAFHEPVFELPVRAPTASQEFREVALKMRRAHLAKIVRAVVVTCSLVCLAGLASAVARSFGGEGEAEAATRHFGLVTREPRLATDALAPCVDTLSATTERARRAEERRATRGKKATRSRYTW